MKIITDREKINAAVKKLEYSWMQEIPETYFTIRQYDKGELLVAPDQPSEFLQICISGYARLYDLNAASGIAPIGLVEEKSVIGDMEFCGRTEKNYFVEAAGRLEFLSLPLTVCRERLDDNPAFLHFLLDCLTEKLQASTLLETSSLSLEEKLLSYMRHAEEEGRIAGVGDTAMKLHCSRRQLQRVLKKLCEEGVLEKEKKGSYHMARISIRTGK